MEHNISIELEEQSNKILDALLLTEFFLSVRSRPTIPNPQTKMLPSLPVKNSVLRQLGIADNELPHELARLKHNLLLPPHTPSQGSNACANSNFSVDVSLYVPGRTWTSPDSKPVWECLRNLPEYSGWTWTPWEQYRIVLLILACLI